jgi:hypothetical protein
MPDIMSNIISGILNPGNAEITAGWVRLPAVPAAVPARPSAGHPTGYSGRESARIGVYKAPSSTLDSTPLSAHLNKLGANA